ncbi:MAG: hypothetical protein GXO91_02000 [FCB group bacterium]|nr:hypothetical protein [FCB group bacterium]
MNSKSEQKSSKKPLLLAVLTALGASLCCVGPLLLVFLGVGGAWAGSLSFFEPWRPLFIGLTLIFLGYAFYRIYGRSKQETCEPGSLCANPKSNRFNKIALWFATILVIILLGIPYLVSGFALDSPVSEPGILKPNKSLVLAVDGMTCSSCAVTVSKSLTNLEGVTDAAVDLERGTATVTFDSTRVTAERLTDATTKVGFPSEKLNNKPEGK